MHASGWFTQAVCDNAKPAIFKPAEPDLQEEGEDEEEEQKQAKSQSSRGGNNNNKRAKNQQNADKPSRQGAK